MLQTLDRRAPMAIRGDSRMQISPLCIWIQHVLTAETRTKHPQQTANTSTIHSEQKGRVRWRTFWQLFTLTCPLRSDGWSTVESLCRRRNTDARVCPVQMLSKYIFLKKKTIPAATLKRKTVQLKGDNFLYRRKKPTNHQSLTSLTHGKKFN